VGESGKEEKGKEDKSYCVHRFGNLGKIPKRTGNLNSGQGGHRKRGLRSLSEGGVWKDRKGKLTIPFSSIAEVMIAA